MTSMTATAVERAWDLYNLKRSLEDQLADVKAMLDEALREAYEDEGKRDLPEGYSIRRSETRDISVKAFQERYPELYDRAIQEKIAAYTPELTKTDVKAAVRAECEGMIRTKEEQARILSDIESGIVTVKFSVVKPADPTPGKVVE